MLGVKDGDPDYLTILIEAPEDHGFTFLTGGDLPLLSETHVKHI